MLQLHDVRTMLESQGLDASASRPERFRELIQSQIELRAKVIRDAGIKAE
jgi:tripartite-type tricarboxylate transporter receptor subunit TctC